MQKEFDYKLFKRLLVTHYPKVIEKFAKTSDNKDVYVLTLVLNGYITLDWNTLSELHYRYEDAYKGKYQDKYSLEYIKFSIGDFAFEEMIDWTDEMDKLMRDHQDFFDDVEDVTDEVYDRHNRQLIECMIEVLKELEPSFIHLNRTSDFVAFVSDFNDEDHFRYATETGPPELYQKVFGTRI
ncbi:DUF4303 domain-containing protein [Paenibacillus sp. CMAA1364]